MLFSYFWRFVGRYRGAARELAGLDDSGYGSPVNPAKRMRLEAVLSTTRLPLINELENGYSTTFLAVDSSLERSYCNRDEPPIMNDPRRIAQALNLSPTFTGGLRDQIERVISYRQYPQANPELVDLTED